MKVNEPNMYSQQGIELKKTKQDESDLPGSINKIFEKWNCLKKTMRNNFHITVSQASKEIKKQNITVHHDY